MNMIINISVYVLKAKNVYVYVLMTFNIQFKVSFFFCLYFVIILIVHVKIEKITKLYYNLFYLKF